MADYDETFEQAESGASMTYPTSAGSIKQGGLMVINGRPCKVVSYSTAKTGKHGHAKASITGIDIFNSKKYEDSLPTSHNVEVPNVNRKEYQVIGLQEDYCDLMDEKGNLRNDLRLPDETEKDAEDCQTIRDGLESGAEVFVTVLSAMGIEKITDPKTK
jgi:translation initiation factor 5A